jgi:hypothetical protein
MEGFDWGSNFLWFATLTAVISDGEIGMDVWLVQMLTGLDDITGWDAETGSDDETAWVAGKSRGNSVCCAIKSKHDAAQSNTGFGHTTSFC